MSNLQQLQRAIPIRFGRLEFGRTALAVGVEVCVRGRRTLELGGQLEGGDGGGERVGGDHVDDERYIVS